MLAFKSEEEVSPLVLSEESEDEREGEDVKQDGSNISINEFVLVNWQAKNLLKYWKNNEKPCHTEFDVGFLKTKQGLGNYKFVYPDVVTSVVDISDIVCKLPQPSFVGGTERAVRAFKFKFKFNEFNMVSGSIT